MEIKTEVKQNNGFTALLQYPDFIKVWFGRTISRFGDALDGIAFMWLMYKLTGSTMLMGTVMAVSAIPSMFGMAAGVFVDRMDKKKVIVWTDLLRGISTGAIALLYILGYLQVWELYAFAFFNSVCEVFSSPARSSAMQVLVRKEHYLVSNSLSQGTGAAAEIAGMGIAAAIIGFWGIGIAILIDAVTFIIAAFTALIAKMETVVEDNGTLNFTKFIKELMEGINIIRSNALLSTNIVLGCMINILLAPFNVLMPAYSDKILNAGEEGYGLMGAAFMIGIILGSLVAGQIGHRFKKYIVVIGGLMAFGFGVALLGVVTNLTLALVICTATGAFLPITSASGMAVVQTVTPKEKMGRVSATRNTIALLGMPLGYAITGFIGEGLNISLTYILLGLIMIVICIPPLFNKEFREI